MKTQNQIEDLLVRLEINLEDVKEWLEDPRSANVDNTAQFKLVESLEDRIWALKWVLDEN